jgi:ribosome-binding factor A
LGKRLASKLRIIPSLKFYLDTALDEAFHVLNLIKQVSSTP